MLHKGMGLAQPAANAPPREIDTATAAAETRARAPAKGAPKAPAEANGAAPAEAKSRIPSLRDDPLRAIAFALSEGAIAFGGGQPRLPGLLALESKEEAQAQALELEQQSLTLRRDANNRDMLKTGVDIVLKAPENQRKALIASLLKTPGFEEIGGTLEAITAPGKDPVAFLTALDENPALFSGISQAIRSGGMSAETGQKIYEGLIEQQAKAAVDQAGAPARVAEFEEKEQAKADVDLVKQNVLKQIDTREANKREAFKSSIEGVDIKDEGTLRKEFTNLSKDFIAVRTAFEKVKRGVEVASAAGDVALVFNFMKMLDPTSVVREGEFAIAASAAGLPDRVIQLARRVDSGERLTPAQRKDFEGVAEQIFNSQSQAQKKLTSEFSRIAKSSGLRSENVIVDFTSQEKLSDEELLKRLGMSQ